MLYFENLLSEYQALLYESENLCKTIMALKNIRILQASKGRNKKQHKNLKSK